MGATSAVVTGAGRGIGREIARRLADAGHLVVVTDVDGEAAVRAAFEIGNGAIGMQQDVRDIASHRAVAVRAAELGELRVWVNNAGILIAGDSWTHDDDELAAILDVNVKGMMAGSNAAVRAMGEDGGRILNVASLSALTPVPGLATYAATKAAILSFTTSLQGDLNHAGLPIQVKALCPDVVATQMVSEHATDPGAALFFAGPKPLAPEAVAAAAIDLLDSRQLFRVVPRWRGLVARSGDVSPRVGLTIIAAMRRRGDRIQAKQPAVQRTDQPR